MSEAIAADETALMSELDFTRRMVAKYRELLLKAAGLQSITIDGQAVSYADLEARYSDWIGRLAQLDGTLNAVLTIDLSNA